MKRQHGEAYIGYQQIENNVTHDKDREGRKLVKRCESNYCAKSKERNCNDFQESWSGSVIWAVLERNDMEPEERTFF